MPMQLVGAIVRLQVQAASLKAGAKQPRWFDPAPLRTVPALRVTADGVTGLADDGDEILDVHNRAHPASKNRGGTNGLSVCFTGHYAAMRERFGDHLADGVAGENVLVAFDGTIGEDDLAAGLRVKTAGGLVALERIAVAAPCVEFSRFALNQPPETPPGRAVTDALVFLNDGMRGYYATPREAAATLRLGDRVFVP